MLLTSRCNHAVRSTTELADAHDSIQSPSTHAFRIKRVHQPYQEGPPVRLDDAGEVSEPTSSSPLSNEIAYSEISTQKGTFPENSPTWSHE